MKNPGLDVFLAATTTFPRSRNHPLDTPLSKDDPDYFGPEEESDFVGGPDFGRWRNPGHKIQVPAVPGPAFAPGVVPEDVIHGELVSPAEQDAADKIINGDHESSSPSENPFVENAREDLHTPSSAVAVHALSSLLSGTHPGSMSDEEMQAAHDYFSRHFTRMRVSPRRGVVLAGSPSGAQMVKRHPEKTPPTYSLINKHGVFESGDPERLVRSMLAFQIMHNEIARRKDKDDDDQDDDQNNGVLTSTSGFMSGLNRVVDRAAEGLHRFMAPKPEDLPPSWVSKAVFEPGHGTEKNENGQYGGYVMHEDDAPADWHRDKSGIAYSPGHTMGELLDPKRSSVPRDDPHFPGHKFTFSSNPGLGYTIERSGGGVRYYVNRLHPAARGAGFDHPPAPKPVHRPPASGGGRLPPAIGAAQTNDLCPVCVSGYLEPYDREFHECLNCGSLVKHIGFDKESSKKPPRSRPRGGLGRGLSDIPQSDSDPFNLLSGGSENPENMKLLDVPEGGFHHPLAEEELNPDYEGELYLAPKDLLGKTAGDVDLLDEHLGKLGLVPVHKPGEKRVYLGHMPGATGSYVRLTEGVGKKGWVLTADNYIPNRERWTQNGGVYPAEHIPLDPTSQVGEKTFWQRLPEAGNEAMPEKSFLASGSHPLEDEHLAHAIRDVTTNGRNSVTYQKVFGAPYQAPALPPQQGIQKERRMLSSVGNPGLARFVGSSSSVS